MAAHFAAGVSSRLATCALRATGAAGWSALRAIAVWPTSIRVSSSSSSSSSMAIPVLASASALGSVIARLGSFSALDSFND